MTARKDEQLFNHIGDVNKIVKTITMAQQTKRTKVETYRIDKMCENCQNGIMYATGRGVTQWHTYWEHKCNECSHIESYENISYPYNEYVDVKKTNKLWHKLFPKRKQLRRQ